MFAAVPAQRLTGWAHMAVLRKSALIGRACSVAECPFLLVDCRRRCAPQGEISEYTKWKLVERYTGCLIAC